MTTIKTALINSIGLVGKQTRRYMISTALTATGVLAFYSPALADNWTDHSGAGITVDTSTPNTTNITQTLDMVKVRGDGDINAGWTVNVAQPNSSAKYVLYDIEGDATRIMGTLKANGQIYIFNQNGVIFGQNSVVDVGSIIASTGNITDANLKADKLIFKDVGGTGEIIMRGTITVADAGLAAFVAPTVKNSGIINAKMGKVAMAAGDKVTLDLYGDDLINIAVNNKLENALVENKGTINASGGHVALSAQAAAKAVDNVVNMDGVIDVSSATVQGGKIVLSGGKKGTVKVTGKLDSSGTTGGKIDVSGQIVNLAKKSEIVNEGSNSSTYVYGTDKAIFTGSLRVGKNAEAEISGAELALGGNVTMGENSHITFDPAILNIDAAMATTIVSALNNVGATVDVSASDEINLNAEIDSLAQTTNSTLNFRDEDANADLTVNLNALIKLGANQSLTGDATTVNVANTGSIQNGVDVASFVDRATINVSAGTYTENVYINKALSLLSTSGRALTNIIGVAGLPAASDQATIFIEQGVDDVTIGDTGKGFHIVGFDSPTPASETAALYLWGDNNNIVIRDNEIEAKGDVGMLTRYGQTFDNITVDGNTFSGKTFDGLLAGTGGYFTGVNVPRSLVFFNGSATNDLTTNVQFTNNTITGTTGGLDIDGNYKGNLLVNITAKGATISGNEFDGEMATMALRVRGSDISVFDNIIDGNGRGHGIVADNVSTLTIGGATFADANTIKNIGLGYGDVGIIIQKGSGITVANNVLENVGQGIYAEGPYAGAPTQLDIAKNKITNATYNAISVNKWNGADIRANVINGTSYGHGITLDLTQDAKVRGNTINNVAANGVSLYYGNDGTNIINNTIDGADKGIFVDNFAGGNSNVTINKNNVSDTVKQGIHALMGALTVKENTVHTAGGNAIDIANSAGVVVADNVVGLQEFPAGSGTYIPVSLNNVKGDGIYVSTSDGAVIKKNTVTETTGNGIFVNASNNATVGGNSSAAKNTVYAVDKDGIKIEGGDGVTVSWNDVTDAARVGIYGGNSTNLTIKKNTISNATFGIGSPYGAITTDWGSDITIADNFISKSTQGVRVYKAGGQNKINNNTINDLTNHGVFVTETDNVRINGNLIGYGTDTVFGGDDTTIGGDGIYVSGIKSGKIDGNKIAHTNGHGINLQQVNADGGPMLDVTFNVIDDTNRDGIHADSGSRLAIEDNKIGLLGGVANIEGDGVYIKAANETSISRNDIANTKYFANDKSSGVQVLNSQNVDIIGNNIDNTGWDGIRVKDSLGAVIAGNDIDNVARSGIYAENSSGSFIAANEIDTTGRNAIRVGRSSDLMIAANLIGTNGGSIGTDGTVGHGNGIRIETAKNVFVLGNVIQNAREDGIYAENVGVTAGNTYSLIAAANFIDNVGDDGIDLFKAGNALITENRIGLLGAGSIGNDGIHVGSSNDVLVTENRIKNTVLGNGISFELSNRAIAESNRIGLGNVAGNINGDGIYLSQSNNSKVLENRIANTKSSSDTHGSGVQVLSSTDVAITGNNIDNMGWDGIRVKDSARTIITGNDIDDVARSGIYAENSSGSELTANEIDGTGRNAIRVGRGTNILIDGNFIGVDGGSIGTDGTVGHGNGIRVETLSNVRIINNEIANTREDGIYAENISVAPGDANSVIIDGNIINNVGDDGIEIFKAGKALITDNRIGLQGAGSIGNDGIHVGSSNDVNVRRNRIKNTVLGDGISFNLSNNAVIVNNRIGLGNVDGNINGDGIFLSKSDNSRILRNQISNTKSPSTNKGSGIHILSSNTSLIRDNIIEDMGWDGVRTQLSGNITVARNDIDNVVKSGVYGESNTNFIVRNNDIDTTGRNGIRVGLTDGLLVQNNRVGLAGGVNNIGYDLDPSSIGLGNGIRLEANMKNAKILNNQIADVREDGIHVDRTDTLEITDNDINRSGNDGIEILRSKNVLINRNDINNSTAVGILASGSGNGAIQLFLNTIDTFDVGMRFESGLIDLTGAENTIRNGGTGMVFAPVIPANLSLVDDDAAGSTPYAPGVVPTNFAGTIGGQVFSNLLGNYIELTNNAFWDFGNNVPLWINGLNSTYDGFKPSDVGGVLTQAQYDNLNSRVVDFIDGGSVGIFFFGAVPSVDIDESQFIRDFPGFDGDLTGLNIRILGLPRVGGAGDNVASAFNNITPFAGGANPADLNNIQTAAGGDTQATQVTGENVADIEPAAGDQNTSCWGDAMAFAGAGQAVNVVYGGSISDTMAAAEGCSTGDL